MERIALEIQMDMNHYEILDDQMNGTNKGIMSTVSSLGTFTTLLLLGTGGWQVYYLYNYFKAKQLI